MKREESILMPFLFLLITSHANAPGRQTTDEKKINHPRICNSSGSFLPELSYTGRVTMHWSTRVTRRRHGVITAQQLFQNSWAGPDNWALLPLPTNLLTPYTQLTKSVCRRANSGRLIGPFLLSSREKKYMPLSRHMLSPIRKQKALVPATIQWRLAEGTRK